MKENDSMEKTRGGWTTPIITVLVRNNPEKNILTVCKMDHNLSGPAGADRGYNIPEGLDCWRCNDLNFT